MTTRRIKRSAVVDGNQVTIDKPAFITLVKKPANQRSFGILRSDTEDGDVSKPTGTKRVPRTKRTEAPADLVRITLPAAMDQAAVTATLGEYGLGSFTVTRSDDASDWVAQNPSAINCTDGLTTVALAEGIVAHIKRTEATNPVAGKGQLSIISVEFDDKTFPDMAAASEWLTRNSVDFDEKALNNPSGKFVLQRMDAPADEEVRQMELEEGVTVTLIRSCDCNIPDGFVAIINEYAYSGWGWGQLDFNAALADCQVSEALWDGLYMLEDLYRNILFWSELPIDVKKELVTRASGQFATYVNGLLDTLPRTLLISVAPATTTQRRSKENDMSTEVKPPVSQAQRTEETVVVAPVVPVAIVPGTPEFNAAIASGVAAELKRREDEAAEETAKATQRSEDEAAEKATKEEAAKVQREELASIVAEATKPLLDQIEALKGTTVLRGAEGDLTQGAQPVKRGTADLFKGALGITRNERTVNAAEAAADAATE